MLYAFMSLSFSIEAYLFSELVSGDANMYAEANIIFRFVVVLFLLPEADGLQRSQEYVTHPQILIPPERESVYPARMALLLVLVLLLFYPKKIFFLCFCACVIK